MKRLTLCLVLLVGVASLASATKAIYAIGTSLTPVSTAVKNKAGSDSAWVRTERAADTTDAQYVGNYKWVRAWVTGSGDTCAVICQKSWDGINFVFKDSTHTAHTPKAYSVLYDSLYIDPVTKAPCTPAPWLRYIIASREAWVQTTYSGITLIQMHIAGGH
jgi:hypothetical protein